MTARYWTDAVSSTSPLLFLVCVDPHRTNDVARVEPYSVNTRTPPRSGVFDYNVPLGFQKHRVFVNRDRVRVYDESVIYRSSRLL